MYITPEPVDKSYGNSDIPPPSPGWAGMQSYANYVKTQKSEL